MPVHTDQDLHNRYQEIKEMVLCVNAVNYRSI